MGARRAWVQKVKHGLMRKCRKLKQYFTTQSQEDGEQLLNDLHNYALEKKVGNFLGGGGAVSSCPGISDSSEHSVFACVCISWRAILLMFPAVNPLLGELQ